MEPGALGFGFSGAGGFIFMFEETNSAWENWIHHLVENDMGQLQSQMMTTYPASPED